MSFGQAQKKVLEEHTHKYMRKIFARSKVVYYVNEEGKRKRRLEKPKEGTEIFKCMIPGCSSYLLRSIAEGKISRCWGCDQDLVLTEENMSFKKPKHKWCRKVRQGF